MSPASVSNFVGDLVAMATAFEKLPQVEADLAEARSTINSHLTTIQRLEAKLLDRANELEAHLSTIRALEVARDDAQFHALEADDRTSRALDFIKATFGNAGSLIQALEPPTVAKPEPAPAEVPVQAVSEAAGEAQGVSASGLLYPGQSENPLPSAPSPMTGEAAPLGTASEANAASSPFEAQAPAPEVAAQPGEPASNVVTHTAETHQASAIDTVSQEASATGDASRPDAPQPSGFSMPPQAKPYAGKTWTQAKAEPGFVYPDRDEWLAGGGTIDNYYA